MGKPETTRELVDAFIEYGNEVLSRFSFYDLDMLSEEREALDNLRRTIAVARVDFCPVCASPLAKFKNGPYCLDDDCPALGEMLSRAITEVSQQAQESGGSDD